MKNHRKDRLQKIRPEDIPRIIKMALEDRTAFEHIEAQFGLKPDDVVIFMRKNLKKSSFLRWRERAHTQGHLKNPKKTQIEADRFKSPNQRIDGSIKQRYRY